MRPARQLHFPAAFRQMKIQPTRKRIPTKVRPVRGIRPRSCLHRWMHRWLAAQLVAVARTFSDLRKNGTRGQRTTGSTGTAQLAVQLSLRGWLCSW
jgi:hypothetical protein